jgi:hypothetical protein
MLAGVTKFNWSIWRKTEQTGVNWSKLEQNSYLLCKYARQSGTLHSDTS